MLSLGLYGRGFGERSLLQHKSVGVLGVEKSLIITTVGEETEFFTKYFGE